MTRTDILLFATGEYSDYSNAAYKVLRPFVLSDVEAEFRAQWKPDGMSWPRDKPSGDAFTAWLCLQGYIEGLDVYEVPIDSTYGQGLEIPPDMAGLAFAPARTTQETR